MNGPHTLAVTCSGVHRERCVLSILPVLILPVGGCSVRWSGLAHIDRPDQQGPPKTVMDCDTTFLL